MYLKALSWSMIISSPQYNENTAFFSSLSVDGLHDWDILLVIPLKLQKTKYRSFHNTAILKDYTASKQLMFSFLKFPKNNQ